MARTQTAPATPATETKAPSFIAWNLTEKGDKTFWSRIGAAWTHKDAKGLTLQLDMLPINGRIVLREPNGEAAGPEQP